MILLSFFRPIICPTSDGAIHTELVHAKIDTFTGKNDPRLFKRFFSTPYNILALGTIYKKKAKENELPIQIIFVYSNTLKTLLENEEGEFNDEVDHLSRYQAFCSIVNKFNTGWSSKFGMLVDVNFATRETDEELIFTGVKSPYSPLVSYEWIKENINKPFGQQENLMKAPLDVILSCDLKKINDRYNKILYRLLNLDLKEEEVTEKNYIPQCAPLENWRDFYENYERLHTVYSDEMTVASISLVHRQPCMIRHAYFKLMDGMIKKLISYKKTKKTNVFTSMPTLKDLTVRALLENGSWNDLRRQNPTPCGSPVPDVDEPASKLKIFFK